MRDGRDAVFEAVVTVFAEVGYSGASMERIATMAGMKKSSLYNHFASKDAMRLEIYRVFREFSVGPSLIEQVFDGRDYASAKDALLRVVTLLEADIADEKKKRLWVFISGEQYHDRKAAELIMELTEIFVADAIAFFKELWRRGLLKAAAPVDTLAISYAYAYHAMHMEYAVRHSQGLPLEGIRARLAELAGIFG